jgi:hypothetical protein
MCAIKDLLFEKLKRENAFWSYKEVKNISDDNLIEHVLIQLDLNDIDLLFLIFRKNHIRKIWKERMIKLGERMYNLNFLIASLYFQIRNPKKYLKHWEHKLSNF